MDTQKLAQLFEKRDAAIRNMVSAAMRGDEDEYRFWRGRKQKYAVMLDDMLSFRIVDGLWIKDHEDYRREGQDHA